MNSTASILYGTSRHRFLAVISLGEGILSLLLSLVLIRSFGILGVAFGIAIPMLFARSFAVPIYACRSVELRFGAYIRRALLPSLPAALCAGATAALLRQVLPENDLMSVAQLVFGVLAVYVGVAFLTLRWLHDELLPKSLRRSGQPVEVMSHEDGTEIG